jgi:hypothetical protein
VLLVSRIAVHVYHQQCPTAAHQFKYSFCTGNTVLLPWAQRSSIITAIISTSTHNRCRYTTLSLLCTLPLHLSVSALFNLGKLMLSQRQDTAAAADLFTRCTLVKSDHAGAHHCLGRMLLEAGKGDCQSMKQKGAQNGLQNNP